MVTFEQAKEIASQKMNCCDCFTEYDKSFAFSDSNFANCDGGRGTLVVTKDKGDCLNFLAALTGGYLGEIVNEGKIS